MKDISRRQLLQRAGALAASTAWGGFAVKDGIALASKESAGDLRPAFNWIQSTRLMIAEGYARPFYHSLEYQPKKALALARRLNCDAFGAITPLSRAVDFNSAS